jgi:hypothetical protein
MLPSLVLPVACLQHEPAFLFVSQAGKLDEQQKLHVGQIRAGHPDLERAYQLSQEFVMMRASRREADLDTWLTQAERSGLPEFKKMAKGIHQDYAAGNRRILFQVEQRAGRGTSQLLEARDPDRLRQGEFRSPAATGPLPDLERSLLSHQSS